jgi:hypothetical protein
VLVADGDGHAWNLVKGYTNNRIYLIDSSFHVFKEIHQATDLEPPVSEYRGRTDAKPQDEIPGVDRRSADYSDPAAMRDEDDAEIAIYRAGSLHPQWARMLD